MTDELSAVLGVAEEARQEAERCAETNPTYAELMFTYAELGELLASGRTDAEFVAECRELMNRVTALGGAVAFEADSQWAVWRARKTSIGGGYVSPEHRGALGA